MSQDSHLARLDALEATVDALRSEIERLHHTVVRLESELAFRGDAAHEGASEPLWTDRLNLDSTVKDGFRVKEATVSVAHVKGDQDIRQERRRRLAELIEDGQAVADAMNSQRDQVKRFA